MMAACSSLDSVAPLHFIGEIAGPYSLEEEAVQVVQ